MINRDSEVSQDENIRPAEEPLLVNEIGEEATK
jgi:hypothetical protein